MCALLGITAGTALAQPTEGSHEVSGSGAFFRPLGTGSGTFNLNFEYGYYLDPMWEVGLRQSYTLNYLDDETDIWNASTAPFVNYNFNADNPLFGWSYDNKFIPYVGAFLGTVYDDDDFTGTLGPQAGVKIYFTDSAFFETGYRYEWFFDSIKTADDFQNANHVVLLGFGYTWGGNNRGDGNDRVRGS
jgi:hypothetical protein